MKLYKSIWLIIALVLLLSLVPSTIFAEELPESHTITGISDLSSDIRNQSFPIGTNQLPELPETISVFEDNSHEAVPIPVTWKADPAFNKNMAGNYTYTPVLPAEYQLSEHVKLPVIKVSIEKLSTSVSGISQKNKKKSRTVLSDTVSISPAFGRTLSLQMYKNGRWTTMKSYTLKNEKTASAKIVYPNNWWKLPSSKWRIQLSESSHGLSFTSSSIAVTATKYYQNPSKYIQIKNKITLKHSGAYNLRVGYMGLKVLKVNRYFKIGNKYWPRYTQETRARVKVFQRKKGLKATGVVNKATWMKMGFSSKSWSTLGAYVSPIQVNPSSTKKDHIEAMISTARKYLGADYVVGASGSPKQGADCSGLIMQGLYAAGVDPYPVSCVRHSKPGYEYESKNLWASKKFKTVSYSSKKRGDLIFYKGRSGGVMHVAIYLGKGKVIESWPNKVVIWRVKNKHRSSIKGVKRVFN